MEWTEKDQEKAFAEGWGLFNVGTSEEPDHQIQRIDDPAGVLVHSEIEEFDQLFDTDAEAINHVALAASSGSLLHRVAMDLAEPGGSNRPDTFYRDWARELYHEEGRIEIDEEAEVSRNGGYIPNGAYVQAWVWIGDEQT